MLISLNKTLKLHVDLNVLAGQHVAVVLQSINLSPHVSILISKGSVREAEIILLASSRTQVVVGDSALGLNVVQVGRHVSVAAELSLGPSHQVGLLGHLEVESSLELALLVDGSGVFVPRSEQIGIGSLQGLGGSSELELASISHL